RSVADARQECKGSKVRGTEGLALSAPSRRPALLGGGAWRCQRRGECAAVAVRLAALHASRKRGRGGRARPLYRLLEALCDQPRGAGRGQGDPGRSVECGQDVVRGLEGAARGAFGAGGPGAEAAAG